MTNTKLLAEQIRLSGYRLAYIAEQCGLTYAGLLPKLKGEREFKQTEIMTLQDLLKLTDKGVKDIFFADDVDKKSTEGGQDGV